MEIKRISQGQMPLDGKYILIYLGNANWFDEDSNVFWKVAKCVYGISKQERERLSKSVSALDRRRAQIFRSEDEDGGNTKPYYFKEFGPASYHGQAVDIWCELPFIDFDSI